MDTAPPVQGEVRQVRRAKQPDRRAAELEGSAGNAGRLDVAASGGVTVTRLRRPAKGSASERMSEAC